MLSVPGCGSLFYVGCGLLLFAPLCLDGIHLAAPPLATPTLPLGIAHKELCNYLYLICGMDLGILRAWHPAESGGNPDGLIQDKSRRTGSG